MFTKVLVANRGAIACRIIRTLQRLGVGSVAVYSQADRHARHVAMADEAILIGPPPANQSYLSIDAVLEAAHQSGAEAIHPGYGFLSENPAFAQSCEDAGIVFIGPTAAQMRSFSLKHEARAMAAKLGVPLLAGSGLVNNLGEAQQAARAIGFPVMLKSTAGGGGIGMRLCQTEEDLASAFEAIQRLAANHFGNSGAFLERFIERARHIEVQIFGDGAGEVVALGERDCSAQRRNQKVIEETPAPSINEETRKQLFAAALKLAREVHYRSAGTVEFVLNDADAEFFFLEVNTRLQVEHGVTEEVSGIDLVEWMVRQACGDLGPLQEQKVNTGGHSIEVRVYAEDAGKNFQPSSGRLTHVAWPVDSVRIETWVEAGTEVTPFYDPMLGKMIVHAPSRAAAIAKLQLALNQTQVVGIETNVDYLREVCSSTEFMSGAMLTSTLGRFVYHRRAIEVLEGGTQTTIQDFPGRIGYWNVGVPPSGPMDSLAFRLANQLVGNMESAAALEITMSGPTLRFTSDCVIALTGANLNATLNHNAIVNWETVPVRSGSVLRIGSVSETGMRCYLAIAGGLEVPEYLGSASTFMLGGFGGHAGRGLRPGDVLHLGAHPPHPRAATLPSSLRPTYPNSWTIGVLYGPHGAPDFFLEEDIEMLFSSSWKVHYHSDRTGVRLTGPRPKWARKDGGEAGLHPSNIHDNAYAIGTLDFTGDMPIILGPDGPSLGGFVCPATIVNAELWKMGQLRPGDTMRFLPLTFAEANERDRQMENAIQSLSGALSSLPREATHPLEPAIIATHAERPPSPKVTYRSDGDRYLLIEFGENVLDLALRLRVHSLETALRAAQLKGILDLTPGIRSLHIHYNPFILPRELLLETLMAAERNISSDLDITVPSRIVQLPLSWDDPQAQLAAEKYMQAVRPDAPWCPSNIEFIRRINGLDSVEDVKRIVFDASYLVLGLGDVYLGAPVATPVDPRQRLVTTKYNPARTWTPENAVGIGGAYLCIYGMEGPGGYQLFGRTLQMWNTFQATQNFEPGTPWLLRFFDQIRFYPVSASDLLDIRDDFPHGKHTVRIEPASFSYPDHQRFLKSIEAQTQTSKLRQQQAFAEERARWEAAGQAIIMDAPEDDEPAIASAIPDGCQPVKSPLTASVWKILVDAGQTIEAGQNLLCLEAMKSELMITSHVGGVVQEVRCKTGALVLPGQTLILVAVP
jgi:urea carboxylase